MPVTSTFQSSHPTCDTIRACHGHCNYSRQLTIHLKLFTSDLELGCGLSFFLPLCLFSPTPPCTRLTSTGQPIHNSFPSPTAPVTHTSTFPETNEFIIDFSNRQPSNLIVTTNYHRTRTRVAQLSLEKRSRLPSESRADYGAGSTESRLSPEGIHLFRRQKKRASNLEERKKQK